MRKSGRLINWDFLHREIFTVRLFGWVIVFSAYYYLMIGLYGMWVSDEAYPHVLKFVFGGLAFMVPAIIKIRKQDGESIFKEIFRKWEE